MLISDVTLYLVSLIFLTNAAWVTRHGAEVFIYGVAIGEVSRAFISVDETNNSIIRGGVVGF